MRPDIRSLVGGLALLFSVPAGTALGASGNDPGTPLPASPDPAAVEASAERAITALATHVRRESHPDALERAFTAYFAFKAAHPEQVRNPYFFFVDYGLDNRTPRGYVFDMDRLELVEGPFTVAHGRGSLRARNGVPARFSNTPGSYMSSLGLYVTQETYRFTGKSGGRRYSSVGLRLRGVSGKFNSAARRRGIVSHGAPYVSARDAGRSEGCPAMEEARARRLLPMIKDGGLVYLFSPEDTGWMRNDPWARAAGD